jgi:hypothetical protein
VIFWASGGVSGFPRAVERADDEAAEQHAAAWEPEVRRMEER